MQIIQRSSYARDEKYIVYDDTHRSNNKKTSIMSTLIHTTNTLKPIPSSTSSVWNRKTKCVSCVYSNPVQLAVVHWIRIGIVINFILSVTIFSLRLQQRLVKIRIHLVSVVKMVWKKRNKTNKKKHTRKVRIFYDLLKKKFHSKTQTNDVYK